MNGHYKCSVTNAARPWAAAQSELCISQGVIPKRPRFYQRAEGSPVAHSVAAESHQKFKMSHYRTLLLLPEPPRAITLEDARIP
jgi:hypothetical protein